jgi:hypothetical protein
MIGKLFVYENVRVSDDRKTINFDYRIDTDEKSFNLTESLTFPSQLPINDSVDRLLRALHLALGISYYKSFIPPKIDHAYKMDQDEADFWNDVFKNGLGEFLYINDLNADQLAKFLPQEGNVLPGETDNIQWHKSALLGIGGGKDSIVAGEILSELKVPLKGFVLATGDNRGQAQAVADKMGVSMLAVERRVDQQILEINKLEGAYNGHIPISLIFALVGCLLATTEKTQYVVVANEASASIPRVEHNDQAINHQWSKSLEFEKSFQDFVHSNISSHLHYTSVIRPLTSIAVAKLFSKYPVYFETFTSDNSHFKINQNSLDSPRWGINSPKTLSSYILLAPWIEDEDLIRIFGVNLLDKPELQQLFLDLLGIGTKPVLDCVGTPSELRLCLSMLKKQNRFIETKLMQLAEDNRLILHNFEKPLEAALTLSDDHALVGELKNDITTKMKELLR